MDCLTHLTSDLMEFETKVETIFNYVTDEPPEIVLENLNLIRSLLSNSLSHISLKNFKDPKDFDVNGDSKDIKQIKEESNASFDDDVNDDNDDNDDLNDEDFKFEEFDEPEEKKTKPVSGTCKRAKKKPPPDIDPNSVQTILHEDKTYYLCTICKSKFLTFQRYLEHQANFDHEELRCTYCGKYFRTLYHLKHHVQKHTKVKLFCCDICGKQLTTKEYVLIHKKMVHGIGMENSTPQECDQCGKTFANEIYLQRHVKFVHTTGKNFACEQCGSTFKKRQYLVRHMNTHNEDKPFSCDECVKPRSFRTMADLEEHKMTHASVKPFQCELCPSQCVRKRSLKAHYIRKHGIIKNFSEDAKPKVNDQQMGSEMHVPTEPKLEEQRMDASGLDPTTGMDTRIDPSTGMEEHKMNE